MTIQWWEGTYSGPWKECKSKGEVLTEEVNKDAVLKEVQLSKSSRLNKEQVEDLKSVLTLLNYNVYKFSCLPVISSGNT